MPSSTPLPDKIGRYQILERVGRGGMGVLYRGHDPVLDREVAVKVMLTDFAEDFEMLRPRFYREAKAVARLQHRNIVTIFEFAEESNQPHIVMEFLRGQPLADRMTAAPLLTLDDKLDVVAQLCSGLAYAHSQGVVHRDVKPANVFLLADGTVKLLDFGIAKLTTSTMTRQGDVLGSASYMSPEQVSGSESVDGRADVWSTGVLLYELLAGRRPFEGDSPTNVIVKILKEDPTPIESLVEGLPKQLAALVGRSLEKDPDHRVARAEEFARELQWIRKALQAAGDLPPMEDTKFANTQVLKALHDEGQKQSRGPLAARTLAGAPAPPAAAAPRAPRVVPRAAPSRPAGLRDAADTFRAGEPIATTTAVAAGGSSKAILVAALAVAVVIGGAGTAVWLGRQGDDRNGAATKPVSTPSNPADPVRRADTPTGGTTTPPLAVSLQPGDPAATPSSSTAPPPRQPSTSKPANPAGEDGPGAKPANPIPPPEDTAKPVALPAKVPAVMVTVTMSGAYPFQVMEGSRVISASSRTHDLQQPNGKVLRIVAADVFLDQSVRVDGGASREFDYSPPGLGRIDIRAVRGDCRMLVGKKDLGFQPWPPIAAVAGNYQVTLSCPDGQNPVNQITVTQGITSSVRFK